ncbi:MAG: hypothetical protein MUE73_07655 [Planctomycetes bacterium]|jgi:hypothetical protein|nr:hypothetical protein [Planctomycetota bacterium]
MEPAGSAANGAPTNQTPHHYVMAHVALRQVAMASPYDFFAVMATEDRTGFLLDLFGQVCRECDEAGPASFGPGDIEVHTTSIGEFATLVIQMPPARFPAEAIMIGVVLGNPMAELVARSGTPKLRYFTLELGLDPATGRERTVLGEWDGSRHVNRGEGPPADPGEFLERVAQLL